MDEGEAAAQRRLDIALFILTAVLLLAVVFLLAWSLNAELGNYKVAIDREIHRQTIDHAVILSYSRAWDFAVVKTGGLFLGFVQVLLGAVYLLRAATTAYSLAVEGQGVGKATLATTSPGLVMMSLGVATVVFVLYAKSDVVYYAPTLQREAAQEQGRTTATHVIVTPAD
jgi:flagellar basal body-associated protein FliL